MVANSSIGVLDASVAVRWIAREQGSEAALALLAEGGPWVAPRLLVTEVSSALRRKAVAADISAASALDGLATLIAIIGSGAITLADDELLIERALQLSLHHRHPVADCLYLALAERSSVPIVTADRDLAKLAIANGIQVTPVGSD